MGADEEPRACATQAHAGSCMPQSARDAGPTTAADTRQLADAVPPSPGASAASGNLKNPAGGVSPGGHAPSPGFGAAEEEARVVGAVRWRMFDFKRAGQDLGGRGAEEVRVAYAAAVVHHGWLGV